MPEKYSAEVTIMLELSDRISDPRPFAILSGSMDHTFKGKYVAKVERGALTKRSQNFSPPSRRMRPYGTSHVRWESTRRPLWGSNA